MVLPKGPSRSATAPRRRRLRDEPDVGDGVFRLRIEARLHRHSDVAVGLDALLQASEEQAADALELDEAEVVRGLLQERLAAEMAGGPGVDLAGLRELHPLRGAAADHAVPP